MNNRPIIGVTVGTPLNPNMTGGNVTSVNGKTGDVKLSADDVGALSQNELQNGVNNALQQAKDSGEFNGKDGVDGQNGKDGQNGLNGIDGISPTVKITQITDGYNISVTDKNGTGNITLLHGKDGTNGKDGATGEQGAKGEKGDAFTFDDFTAEQLESLKGEKGDKGDKGEQGLQGIQGEQGIQGVQGIPGEKGEKGDTGAAGKDGQNGTDGKTPMKGVDYYTDADKAEIVNAVIAALPTAEGASF